MREEPLPRRRTLDGSSRSPNIDYSRRSTIGGNGTDASGSGGGARISPGENNSSRPVPPYSSAVNMPSAVGGGGGAGGGAGAGKGAPGGAKSARPTAVTNPPAPAFTVPKRSPGAGSMNPPVADVAYFHTKDWPFAAEQLDRQKEELLGQNDRALAGKTEIPQLNPGSSRPIEPGVGRLGSALAEWDEECALKHLDAVGPSVVSHDDLHGYTLMEGEFAEDVIDLAGLENAPGLLNDVTQRCRLIFTNKKRLVFTQANHSAEVGVPTMHCCAALFHCFHDRWSTRKWSSFYSAINASEVLQVFVQQTLTTSYMRTTCRGDEIFEFLWCKVGGVMRSEKTLDEATQTLGDYDQGSCVQRWDKTRHMRHALVIRYLDCATNSITQTTAMAHPDTPASKLYEMARSIEANISVRSTDWLKCKAFPTPLSATPFSNAVPSGGLFRRKSYKFLMFGLFIVAFIVLFFNFVAGFFMIVAIAVAITGAYAGSGTIKTIQQGSAFGAKLYKNSVLVGSQGVGGTIYFVSLLATITGSRQ